MLHLLDGLHVWAPGFLVRAAAPSGVAFRLQRPARRPPAARCLGTDRLRDNRLSAAVVDGWATGWFEAASLRGGSRSGALRPGRPAGVGMEVRGPLALRAASLFPACVPGPPGDPSLTSTPAPPRSAQENRLRWRATQPITVLELRALRLPQPLELAPRDDLWGCFSWLDLGPSNAEQQRQLAAAAASTVPALGGEAFAERQALCRQQLAQLADLRELPLP